MVGGTGGEDDPVKILDFGLAKAKWASVASTALTAPGTVLGTYAYHPHRRLDDAISDTRDPQRPLPPIGLGDEDPANRLRPVASRPQLRLDVIQEALHPVGFDGLEVFAVDAC
jgi:hypothetical protein